MYKECAAKTRGVKVVLDEGKVLSVGVVFILDVFTSWFHYLREAVDVFSLVHHVTFQCAVLATDTLVFSPTQCNQWHTIG